MERIKEELGFITQFSMTSVLGIQSTPELLLLSQIAILLFHVPSDARLELLDVVAHLFDSPLVIALALALYLLRKQPLRDLPPTQLDNGRGLRSAAISTATTAGRRAAPNPPLGLEITGNPTPPPTLTPEP